MGSDSTPPPSPPPPQWDLISSHLLLSDLVLFNLHGDYGISIRELSQFCINGSTYCTLRAVSCQSPEWSREIRNSCLLSNHASQRQPRFFFFYGVSENHVHHTLLLLVKGLKISSHQITTVRFNTLLRQEGGRIKEFPTGQM